MWLWGCYSVLLLIFCFDCFGFGLTITLYNVLVWVQTMCHVRLVLRVGGVVGGLFPHVLEWYLLIGVVYTYVCVFTLLEFGYGCIRGVLVVMWCCLGLLARYVVCFILVVVVACLWLLLYCFFNFAFE